MPVVPVRVRVPLASGVVIGVGQRVTVDVVGVVGQIDRTLVVSSATVPPSSSRGRASLTGGDRDA